MDREQVTLEAARGESEGPADDVRLIAFYLPQYYPIAENDRWWGPGFTDWRNVVRSTPLFDGHYQPHLPGALGFYDLRIDDVRRQQIALARASGIHGFCYYYYWFNGRRILEYPLDRYIADPAIDFPFCICWANENWSRRWDGGKHEVLLEQEHDYSLDMKFIRDVMPLLKDPRYIRVDGKPILVVYRADLLKIPAATVAGWRQECEKAGLPGIHLCAAQTFDISDPRPHGFDSACEFPPHQSAHGQIAHAALKGLPEDFAGCVCDYELVARHSLTAPPPDYLLYRGIFPSWDNTARKRSQALIFHNADPARFEYWLRGLITYTRRHLTGDRRIIFVNAWNEWAEGAHLEPDLKHGSAFLEATKRALAGQTDPEQLLRLLQDEIAQIGDADLRKRIQGYAGEIGAQLRHIGRTVEFFTGERQMVERLRQEREAAVFYPRPLDEVFGAGHGSDIECSIERINGRPMRDGLTMDLETTVHLEGWVLSHKVIPDAETSARFLLLRNETDGSTYAGQIFGRPRQDITLARPKMDPAYTANCGFDSLFSLSKVPPGIYRIGCGVKNNSKAACVWTQYRVEVVSAERHDQPVRKVMARISAPAHPGQAAPVPNQGGDSADRLLILDDSVTIRLKYFGPMDFEADHSQPDIPTPLNGEAN